jgi:hypothetical protein
MVDTWLARIRELGSVGAHLGVGPANARAVRFYEAYGWRRLPDDASGRTLWFGLNF